MQYVIACDCDCDIHLSRYQYHSDLLTYLINAASPKPNVQPRQLSRHARMKFLSFCSHGCTSLGCLGNTVTNLTHLSQCHVYERQKCIVDHWQLRATPASLPRLGTCHRFIPWTQLRLVLFKQPTSIVNI